MCLETLNEPRGTPVDDGVTTPDVPNIDDDQGDPGGGGTGNDGSSSGHDGSSSSNDGSSSGNDGFNGDSGGYPSTIPDGQPSGTRQKGKLSLMSDERFAIEPDCEHKSKFE